MDADQLVVDILHLVSTDVAAVHFRLGRHLNAPHFSNGYREMGTWHHARFCAPFDDS
jgi:hypothetical protein